MKRTISIGKLSAIVKKYEKEKEEMYYQYYINEGGDSVSEFKLHDKYRQILLDNGDDMQDILNGRLDSYRPSYRAMKRAAADGSKLAARMLKANGYV